MFQDMGNVELFELFETDPKTQCKECLSHWSEGSVHCTYGHLLKESEANRGVIQYALDLLSIPDCRPDMITIVVRTITSVNQFSLHGAVSEMCEEYESCS